MSHVPYGYVIENGRAKIDETSACKLRILFEEYIECKSMRSAAVKAQIKKTHSVIGRLIKNKVYLGTEYYPQIIDEETFNKAQELRQDNAIKQNRIRPYKQDEPVPMFFNFSLDKVETKYDDPYKQAEYAYSQIKEGINE